jgi:uncharacterized DUF497 family protein
VKYIFEWDYKKAKTNLLKHKIGFEDATSVFKDENMISIFDEEHSTNEERWITIGMDLKTRTLVVVHTFVSIDKDNTKIRIISARKATKKEQKAYWEN